MEIEDIEPIEKKRRPYSVFFDYLSLLTTEEMVDIALKEAQAHTIQKVFINLAQERKDHSVQVKKIAKLREDVALVDKRRWRTSLTHYHEDVRRLLAQGAQAIRSQSMLKQSLTAKAL